jgi:cell division cycle 14
MKEYEHYERVENGDLNWIIPNKFVAFMGPIDNREDGNRSGHGVSKYVDIFKKIKINKVIRLNDEKYDRKRFID